MKYYVIAAAAVVMVSIGIFMGFSTFSDFLKGGSNRDVYPLGGTLLVKLRDPPNEWGDASHVYIRYSSVEVHKFGEDNKSGWYMVVKGDAWIDLKDVLTSSKVIGNGSLPSGDYNLIRFEIMDGIVTVEDRNYTAPIQNGKLTIAIMRGGVKIEGWQTSSVVIDVMPKVVGKSGKFVITPAAKAYVED